MKKFLEELEKELTKNGIKKSEIEEILHDHEEMIKEAKKEGLSDEEIETKFGSPKHVADELGSFSQNEDDVESDIEGFGLFKSFSVQEDFNINIGLVDEDFELSGEDSSEIKVYYKGKIDLNKYQITFEDNVFTLKEPKMGFSLFGIRRSASATILIKIPYRMIPQCIISAVNADAIINKIKSGTFQIKSTNGDMSLADISSKLFKTDTVNGDMKIKRLKTEAIEFVTISGDVTLEHIDCENNFAVNSVSGDMNINNMHCGECSFHTVSGDIEGNNFYPTSISVKSVSGDIDIRNEDMSHQIEIKSKKSVSGSINIGKK
ncbi:MAG: DUF4097 family beta strand repeat protein [Firmicutes bacterium]|nr:DUF4097 family beta strand repeat protein [Bacillota bacterium]